jgi:type 1 glutamine amidotransferase
VEPGERARRPQATVRNIVLTGGWGHAFDRAAPVLAEVLGAAGVDSLVVDDLDDAAALLAAGDVDLLTVYAAQGTIDDDSIDEQERAVWARPASPRSRDAIEAFLSAGGGLVALHTAALCFGDWPRWSDWLGGGWHSAAPARRAPSELLVSVAANHPIVDGVSAFSVVDAHCTDLTHESAVTVLLRAASGAGAQPVLWVHEEGAARVVYDALGHDEHSLSVPQHARVLRRSARWVAGDDDVAVAAVW